MYYRWLVGNTLAHLGEHQGQGQGRQSHGAVSGEPRTDSAAPDSAESTACRGEGLSEKLETGPPGMSEAAAATSPELTESTTAAAEMTAESEAARGVVAAVLARESSRLLEAHLAEEPDAKWPLLTLARLREAQVGEGGEV